MTEVLEITDIVRLSKTSASTVNRAMNKWKAGVDDGEFPPPLKYRRKGDSSKAARVTTSQEFDDWIERWPDA